MLPFAATWTLMTSPHLCLFGPFMVAGSVGQSGTRRYGFGSVDGFGTVLSLPPWACAATAIAATTATPTVSVAPTRPVGGISSHQSTWKLISDGVPARSNPVREATSPPRAPSSFPSQERADNPDTARVSRSGKPIYTGRSVAEHRAAITRREILRQLLELVPQHRVGTRESVDREVALEHAARWCEAVDHVKVPIPVCRKQLVGRGRLLPLVPAVTVHHHLNAAHLGHDVRAPRQFRDGRLPSSEYLIAPPGVLSNPNRSAEMVEDDRRVRKRLRQISQLRDLRVVHPALERQPVGAQVRVTAPKDGVKEQVWHHGWSIGSARRHGSIRQHARLRPRSTVTDAAEALRACGDLGLEHGRDAVAQPQICRTDNACGGAQIAISPAGALCRDTLYELGLADNPEVFGAVGTIHRPALDEHRLTHVVPFGVRDELREKVPLRGAVSYVPEMMMRVDDRQLWLERGLSSQRQPVLIGRCR